MPALAEQPPVQPPEALAVDPPSPSDRRASLLTAVAEGRSPVGGPRLTRDELDVLQRGAGGAGDAIVSLRLLEWRVRDADASERPTLRAEVDALDTELRAVRSTLWDENDLAGAKALQAAESALARSFGDQPESSSRRRIGPAKQVRLGHRTKRPTRGKRRKLCSGDLLRAQPSRQRMLVLGGALGAAIVIGLTMRPPPLRLPDAVPPPQPAALSAELELHSMSVVAGVVYARAGSWETLLGDTRTQATARACQRALALGFRGLVLLDGDGKMLISCSDGEAAST